MPRTHRPYPPEFRAEAVRLVSETDRPVAQVAAEIGVGAQLLGRWVQQSKPAAEAEDRTEPWTSTSGPSSSGCEKKRRSTPGSVVLEKSGDLCG